MCFVAFTALIGISNATAQTTLDPALPVADIPNVQTVDHQKIQPASEPATTAQNEAPSGLDKPSEPSSDNAFDSSASVSRMELRMDLSLIDEGAPTENSSDLSLPDFITFPESPEVVEVYDRLAAYESSETAWSIFDFKAIADTARTSGGLGSILRNFARRLEQRQDISHEELRREYLSTGLNGETAKYLAGVAAPRW